MPKTAAWLPSAAASEPHRVALETAQGALTYAELDARARLAAGRLAALGAHAGDRIALRLAPGADFAVALWGCLLLGAVAMPIDLRLGEVETRAQLASAALAIAAPLDGRIAPAPLLDTHDCAAVAAVIHTSGTSGAPKPVELTYGNWLASARGSAARLGHERGERWLCALPLSHVGGLSILVRSAIYATTAIVHDGFDVERTGLALRRDGVTLVSLVPTALRRLLDAGAAPSPALRCALIGGGPLDGDLAERAQAGGFALAQTYGLTEACSQVTTSRIGEPDTAGEPLAGTTVQISPDGEILVAGPTVAPSVMDADGMLHTGDAGRLDPQGRLTVTGRAGDTIVTGGENVSPAEVEGVLEAHPAVLEAAVFARPDPEWGEAVAAAVVLQSQARAGEADLREHCRRSLAGFKVPKAIDFVAALPRTPSGKVRCSELR